MPLSHARLPSRSSKSKAFDQGCPNRMCWFFTTLKYATADL